MQFAPFYIQLQTFEPPEMEHGAANFHFTIFKYFNIFRFFTNAAIACASLHSVIVVIMHVITT